MGYESDSTRRYLPSYIEFADNATHTQAVVHIVILLDRNGGQTKPSTNGDKRN